MTKLEKKLRANLRRLGIHKHDRIVVAVSGGADSTALWDALARWSQHFAAAHLNHLLRGAESDDDENFVRTLAANYQCPVFIEREKIATRARTNKKNLEATARTARYEFLARAATQFDAQYIFTAHTQDDQAETILMRLLRGTAAAGLQGIHAVRNFAADKKIVRPLLDITRTEIIAHCQHYNLNFRQDSSNNSIDFLRNRVRHELLPLLKTYNANLQDTLIRTAQQSTEDEDFLATEAQKILANLAEGAALNFLPMLTLHSALRRRVLRQWVQITRGDLHRIARSHLLSIERLMMAGEGGSYVELPGQWRVTKQGKTLHLQPK